MNGKKIITVLGILAAGIILLVLLVGMGSAHGQEVNNPHPTPPTNSVTAAMLQSSIITDVAVSPTAAIQVSKLATTTAQDFVNDATETYTGAWAFTNFPTIPTSTPTSSNQVVSLNYFNNTAIAVSPVTNQVQIGTATSSVIVGATSSFSLATQLAGASTTASSVLSITVPAGINYMQVTVTGAGGGGQAASFGASNGGNHSYFSTSSSTTVSTSTTLILCGAGGGGKYANGGSTPYGGAGQGVNGYPDTYGGAQQTNSSGGNPGTCFVSAAGTNISSSTASNGGSNQSSGGGGGELQAQFPVTPGTTYYYLNGSGGTGSTNGANGTVVVNWLVPLPTSGDQSYGTAIGNEIITGGATPSVSSCGTTPSVVGNNTAGVITTGSGTVTSCTLNFATSTPYSNPAYYNAPVCVLSDSLTSITPDVSAVSSTAVTFSFSATLTSGKIYYQCLSI